MGQEDTESDYIFANFLADPCLAFNGRAKPKPAGRAQSREADDDVRKSGILAVEAAKVYRGSVRVFLNISLYP